MLTHTHPHTSMDEKQKKKKTSKAEAKASKCFIFTKLLLLLMLLYERNLCFSLYTSLLCEFIRISLYMSEELDAIFLSKNS